MHYIPALNWAGETGGKTHKNIPMFRGHARRTIQNDNGCPNSPTTPPNHASQNKRSSFCSLLFHDFVIPNPSPFYCTYFKMLSNFLDRFAPLLVLTSLLNEEFCLHFLCNFLITLSYSSTIFLHLLLLCPLCHPPTEPRAMGRSSPTPSLPPLAIRTANGRLENPCHRSAWFADHYGRGVPRKKILKNGKNGN